MANVVDTIYSSLSRLEKKNFYLVSQDFIIESRFVSTLCPCDVKNNCVEASESRRRIKKKMTGKD